MLEPQKSKKLGFEQQTEDIDSPSKQALSGEEVGLQITLTGSTKQTKMKYEETKDSKNSKKSKN